MRLRVLGVALGIAGLVVGPSAAWAGSLGEQVYQNKCRSCHGAAGEGVGSFPALSGNSKMADPTFVESVVTQGAAGMPGFGNLPAEEIAGLVDYLVTTMGGATSAGAGPSNGGELDSPEAATPAPLPPGDAARGEDYFLGKARLTNGGAACAACHAAGNAGGIGGGSLAADLTNAAGKFGGAEGLAASLSEPAFAVMRASYENKSLTEAERADLAAFLEAVASGQVARDRSLPGAFWLVSLLGTAVLFVLMGLLWPRRGASPAQRIRKGQ